MFTIEVILTVLGLALTLPFVNWKWYWRIVAGIIMTMIAFKFHVLFYITHDLFSPAIPKWIQVGSGGAFAAFFIMTGLALINVTLQTLIWLVRKYTSDTPVPFPRKWYAAGNYFCAAFAMIISATGCVNGLLMPDVRERKLYFPDLPDAAEGLRIAVVADLHVTYMTDDGHLAEIVKKVNSSGADIIVFTGDNADGRPDALGHKLEAIKDLRAPLGVWGVTGNHEYYQWAMPEWLEFYKQHDLQMLFNESISFPEHGIVLGGVPDEVGFHFGAGVQDFSKVFAETEENLFRIILVHRPGGAYESSRINADLQISGHTHGGMMPVLDMMVASFNDGMDSGIFHKYGLTVAVSNGTGIWNGFPLRLFCPTEIMLLEIHKGTGK